MLSENELSRIVVNIIYLIHVQYGPGLFESIHEEIFCHEIQKENIPFVRQKGIRIVHDNVDMGIAFIPDVIIDNKLIIEFKSVEKLAEVHYKQVLTYLRLTDIKLGLLVNFNVPLIKDGIHRIVNNLF